MTSPAEQDSRFSSAVYGARIARAAELARSAGLDGLVVTPGPDLRYLTGSRADSFERLTALVIAADTAKASVVLPRLELASLKESAVGDLGMTVPRLGRRCRPVCDCGGATPDRREGCGDGCDACAASDPARRHLGRVADSRHRRLARIADGQGRRRDRGVAASRCGHRTVFTPAWPSSWSSDVRKLK